MTILNEILNHLHSNNIYPEYDVEGDVTYVALDMHFSDRHEVVELDIYDDKVDMVIVEDIETRKYKSTVKTAKGAIGYINRHTNDLKMIN